MLAKKPFVAIVTLLFSFQLSPALAQTDATYLFSASQPLYFSESKFVNRKTDLPDMGFRPIFLPIDKKAPEYTSVFDRTHKLFNKNFKKLFHQIDDYFGDGQQVSRSNQSWARIRIDTIRSAANDPEIKGAIKLRVVLPRAERRFRLLFSTEDDQSAAATTGQSDENDNNEYSLALRFIRQARENGFINFDLGTRYRDKKAQIFSRVNIFFTHDLTLGFRSSFSNSLYYYSASGYENNFRYDLTRPINSFESVLFRGSTELQWKKNQSGTVIGETVGLYSDIDNKRSVAVEGLASYTTALNNDQTENFLGAEFRVRFRHNIWRKWFYYELWPTMSWKPINNYSASFGGLFRVEMVLGEF